jgi:hypothetical protein
MIDAGIVQPLKWYDTIEKQNFRKDWVKNGMRFFNLLLTPKNSIIPFQVRRYHSLLPINTLDLYNAHTDVFELDILAKLPAPANNHIKVYQMGIADNIVFTQTTAFATNLDEGEYYLHLSDGVNNFYSEVFKVVCYAPTTKTVINQIDAEKIPSANIIINSGGDNLIISNLPY